MRIRIVARSLVRDWRFSLAVVFIMSAAVALSTAMFRVAEGSLFDPLPVPRVERLVRVYFKAPWGDNHWPRTSFAGFRDLRDEATSFASLAAFASGIDADFIGGDGDPVSVRTAVATGNFFETADVRPSHGRFFRLEDDQPDGAVAVISDDFWSTRFARRPGAVGERIRLNGTPFAIIGVAPPRFHGVAIDTPTDVWIPSSMAGAVMTRVDASTLLAGRDFYWLSVVGRLREGVTLEAADAELKTIATRRATAEKSKDEQPKALSAISAAMDPDGLPQSQKLVTLFGALVGVVLLIACMNAGGLQIVRGERRQRELAVRAALGASRGRLFRELSLEGLLLGVVSTAAGVFAADLIVKLLAAYAPDAMPLLLHASLPILEPRVLIFALAMAVVVSFACGVGPAVRLSRLDVHRLVRGEQTAGKTSVLRTGLIVGQVALSVVLLVPAGLMVRTLLNMRRIDPGIVTDRAVVGRLDLSRQGFDKPRAQQFFEDLRARLAASPVVADVALAFSVPVGPDGAVVSIAIPGATVRDEDQKRVVHNMVSPGFFRAIGAPLLRGREFGATDHADAEPVAIVNDALARSVWADTDAVGQQLIVGDVVHRIVGVAPTTKHNSLVEDPVPAIFVPLSQAPVTRLSVFVRGRNDAAEALRVLQDTVKSLNASVPLHQLQTLDAQLAGTQSRQRALAAVLAGLGVVALLLAMSGLYSVVAYRTATRRREFGIRVALGALPANIREMVLRQTLSMLVAGIGSGILLSLLVSGLTAVFLFGVEPGDPATTIVVSAIFLATGLFAAYLPARRAANADPAETLRAE